MAVDKVINSLDNKECLNNELWNKNFTIRPKVRKHILKIAEDFFEDLNIPWAELEDVRMTGSSANYNWSKYSDIDIHLIVDYSLVDKNEDFVEAYFSARKNLWNNQHDIKISNFDVEVYVEDANNPSVSSGVYSIMLNEWIKKPKKMDRTINKKLIKNKVNTTIRLIKDLVIDKLDSNEYKEAINFAEKISEKLKKMRLAGLERSGEYSVENLTYKVLRRKGYLEKLWTAKIDAYDKMMSI